MATRKVRLQEFIKALAEEANEELGLYEGLLERIGAPKQSKRPQLGKRTKLGKPCCTKNEVITIVARLLKDNGQLSATEIEELAKDKLANEQNKSLSGFAMRLKETLRDPQFVETQSGTYELASNSSQR